MPNHVHLIPTPTRADGLGLAVREAHRRYTNFINARGRWTGHLFQSRFASVAMDKLHLLAAVSYVSLNPVRAGLAGYAVDWAWSSVRAHMAGKDDGLVQGFSHHIELMPQTEPGASTKQLSKSTSPV